MKKSESDVGLSPGLNEPLVNPLAVESAGERGL